MTSTSTDNGLAADTPPSGPDPTAEPQSPFTAVAQFARAHPWTIVNVLIAIVAFGVVRWARSSPGYDPYGWLVWGYQGIRGTLNLAGAPSWKPVTFLFTLPYSIFGHLSFWLWLTTATAFGFGGPIIGGRIAYRIVRPQSRTVWPAVIAACFTATAMVTIVAHDTQLLPYLHYVLSFQSDPMLVTFFLLAVDAFISGKYRLTHTWLLLVSLGRPEGWVILGPFALWLWFTHPQYRKFSVAELILIPALWFGVPVLCGQPWDVAGNLAQNSPRAPHGNKIVAVIDRYRDLTFWPVFAGAAIATVYGAVTRNRLVLVAVAAPIAWMICEIGFALHGWPAVARYMFEAGAATVVLGGVGIGLLATWAWDHGPPARRVAAGALAVVLVAFLVPYGKDQWDSEHKDFDAQRVRTQSIAMLHGTISELGGPKFINSCGIPTTFVGTASILAWYTHNNVSTVGYNPAAMIAGDAPVVLFNSVPGGWNVTTYHLTGPARLRCAALDNVSWITTPSHPHGVLVHG